MTPPEVFRERRKSRARALEGRYRLLRKMFVAEFIEAVVAALVVAAILRFFFVSVYRIPTASMAPTLIPGDFIVAWKSSYGIQIPFSDSRFAERQPERGDVVIFHLPDDDTLFVKRVVGIAGDRIEIRDGKLFLNELAVSQPIASGDSASALSDWEFAEEKLGDTTHRVMKRKTADQADFLAPLVVPPGQVFLMGDARSESTDSRIWGPLPTSLVIARASFIAFSLTLESASSMLPPDLANPPRAERLFKAVE